MHVSSKSSTDLVITKPETGCFDVQSSPEGWLIFFTWLLDKKSLFKGRFSLSPPLIIDYCVIFLKISPFPQVPWANTVMTSSATMARVVAVTAIMPPMSFLVVCRVALSGRDWVCVLHLVFCLHTHALVGPSPVSLGICLTDLRRKDPGLGWEEREEKKKRRENGFLFVYSKKRKERVGRFRKEKKTKIFFFSFSFLTFLSFYSQCSAAALPFELHVHPCCCCDLLLFFGVRSLPGHEVGCAFIFRFHFHFHSSPGWSSRSSVHWQRLLSLLFSLYFRFHVVFLFFFFPFFLFSFFWNFHFLKKIRLTFSFSHFISSMFEKCRTHAIC